MSHPTHREPTDPLDMTEEEFRRVCDEYDNGWANTYAERERDAYLDYHEVHDNEVMDELDGPDTSDDWSVSKTLRSAALYLAAHGWIQGSYYDTADTVFTPSACLVGAIGMVCYGGPVDAPALNYDDPGWEDFDAALRHLDGYLIETRGDAVSAYKPVAYEFNDTRGRIVDEVIAVLNDAADRWNTTRVGVA